MATKSTLQLIEEMEQKGMLKAAAAMSQRLIAHLERRFPDFPDSLKDRIRQVTDAKKLIDLAFV